VNRTALFEYGRHQRLAGIAKIATQKLAQLDTRSKASTNSTDEIKNVAAQTAKSSLPQQSYST